MTPWSSILIALGALRANALRSFLAILGVIIGVASVVTMVAISDGARASIEARINSLGTNMLILRPGSRTSGGHRGGAGSARKFTDADVTALRGLTSDIQYLSGTVQTGGQIVAGNTNWATTIYGIEPDYLDVRDWVIEEGRTFTAREARGASKIALVGQDVSRELFGEASPIGQRIRIKKTPYRIVGLLREKGQSAFGSSQDDVVMVPIHTARTRLIGKANVASRFVERIYLKVADGADLTTVESDVEELLRDRRRIAPGAASDFRVSNMAEFLRARTETQRTFTFLLMGTAAVALFVGGIGIMNIMLVSVTERTREIGLRLAIGARKKDIMTQFLIEAVTLTAFGAIFGIALGVAISYGAAKLGDWPVLLSPSIIAIAMGFASLVGIFFGFYPAKKAAQLNPIDALRYE